MWLLWSLGCFALAVLLHGAVVRLPLRIDSVTRFLLVGFPIGGVVVIVSIARGGLALEALAAILLYAFLCELYIFCFTLVMSSVSATMLIMLRRGAVEMSSLTATYEPRGMVQLRTYRLANNGFLERAGDRFVLTPKGMRLHCTFGALRRFFGHEPS